MVTFSPVSLNPITICGVIIYNDLPASCFVDVDHESITPIGGDLHPAFDVPGIEEILDQVIKSGVLPNGVHYGITDRNKEGYAEILIDSATVTEETIRLLIEAGIITR